MLSDARNLWKAMQMLNENITTALEGLDQTDVGTEEQEIEEEKDELEIYKKMLDDAQMQHFELSKHSRLLLAEKDAEILIWKRKYHEATGESGEIDVMSNLNDMKKNIDNDAMILNLKYAEEELRQAHLEKNDALVKLQNLNEISAKCESLKETVSSLEANDRQKNETIENLVSEYSKLAAETENKQNHDANRIIELERENEILAMKMHALEHSITELADRASDTSHSSSGSSSTVDTSALTSELKELRAKVVNLQFDLKEKENDINKLRQSYEQLLLQSQSMIADNNSLGSPSTTFPMSPASSYISTGPQSPGPVHNSSSEQLRVAERTIMKLQQELESVRLDVVRVTAEKKESEVAGRSNYENMKSLQREIDMLKAQLIEVQNQSIPIPPPPSSSSPPGTTKIQQQQQSSSEEMDNLYATIQSSQIALQQSESKLQQLLIENEKNETLLRERLQIKELSLSETESKIIQLQQELASTLESKKASESNYQSIIAELQATMASSETIIAGLRKDLQRLEKESEAMKINMSSSQEDSTIHMQQLLDTHAREVAALQLEIHNRELAFTSSTQQHKEALIALQQDLQTEKMKDLANIKLEYESSIAKLSQQLDVLRDQVRQRERALVDSAASHEELLQEATTTLREELLQQFSKEKQEAITVVIIDEKKKAKDELERFRQQMIEQAMSREKELLAEAVAAREKALLDERIRHEGERAIAVRRQREEDEVLKTLALQQHTDTLTASHKESMIQATKAAEALLNKAVEQERNHAQQVVKEIKAQSDAMINKLETELKELQQNLDQRIHQAVVEAESRKERSHQLVLQQVKGEAQMAINKAMTERDEFQTLFMKENKTRKALHNKLLEIQGNIRVYCRVRPVLDVERRSGEGVDVTEFPSDEDLVIHRDASSKAKFEFDRVFPPGCSQESVFEAVQPMCVSVLDGYNVCIFAYGQTGSGKTFTMEGYGPNKGVSPRAVEELFSIVTRVELEWSYELTFSMLEIYNETIRDLLDNSKDRDKERLDVRQTPDGNVVPGLTEVRVTSASQVMDLMSQGQANRAVGAHDMNEHSSRSHSILTIVCRGRCLIDTAAAGTTSFGKIHLIDLAGSERVGKTDATGDRLKEAQNINRSLSALGDVISSLGGKKAAHVPYRNSKLTFLLQDSLGGNSKVLMFVNISPAVYNLSETLCSLNFATRCRNVELGQAKRNVDDKGGSSKKQLSLPSSLTGGGGGGSGGSYNGNDNPSKLSTTSSSSSLTPSTPVSGIKRTTSSQIPSVSSSSSSSTFRK